LAEIEVAYSGSSDSEVEEGVTLPADDEVVGGEEEEKWGRRRRRRRRCTHFFDIGILIGSGRLGDIV